MRSSSKFQIVGWRCEELWDAELERGVPHREWKELELERQVVVMAREGLATVEGCTVERRT